MPEKLFVSCWKNTKGVDMVKDRGVYWLDLWEDRKGDGLRLCPARAAREASVPGVDPREAPDVTMSADSVEPSGHGGDSAAAAEAAPGIPDHRAPIDMPDSEEQPPIKAKRIPPTVTSEPWNLHLLTHYPFRSWCPCCVAGKAKEDPHRSKAPQDSKETPKWCADYFFLGTHLDPVRAHPVLNNLDVKSGAMFPGLVRKGNVDYAIELTLEGMRFTGRSELLLMTDQENAIGTVAEKVAQKRAPHDTQMINTPKGSSQSAGRIERANQESRDRGPVSND